MMSGGVDSSVAAAMLKEQGYEVTGIFMRCWSLEALDRMGLSRDLYGCFWEDDLQDAQLVAKKLDIPFEVWDFQDEYKQRVVDYMIREYKNGRTPNPDVMCNGEIKFGIFYEQSLKRGVDYVATGHYARVFSKYRDCFDDGLAIARGLDFNKDQSYFLWQVRREQIEKVLFPIGEFATKAAVRQKAQELGLVTANKPDSQGLCFIGDTPLRELLLQTLGKREGEIICEEDGRVLGRHLGAFLYTIGQREKLGLSGGPWFVSQIDVNANEVFVTHQTKPKPLYKTELEANWCNWQQHSSEKKFECSAQIRYRQQAESCIVTILPRNKSKICFHRPVRAAASGQSIVFYNQEILLGGGVIV